MPIEQIKRIQDEARRDFKKKFIVQCSDCELLKDVNPKLVLSFIDSLIEKTVSHCNEICRLNHRHDE